MAKEHVEDPIPVLSLHPEQALIGIRTTENGREVTHFFAEEDIGERTATDQALEKALAAIGSCSDLDWDETIAALDRIRHESTSNRPIEGPRASPATCGIGTGT